MLLSISIVIGSVGLRACAAAPSSPITGVGPSRRSALFDKQGWESRRVVSVAISISHRIYIAGI